MAALLALACSLAAPASGDSLEYTVKAAYLYKFAPFVQWPDTAFDGPAAPFTVCIAGPDPFGASLEQATAGQRLGARPVVVRRLARTDKLSGCQILYVKDPQSGGDSLARARGAPVLTVTDGSLSDSPAGVIAFLVVDAHVRFRIDEAAARQNGLAISSKLLSLSVPLPAAGPRASR